MPLLHVLWGHREGGNLEDSVAGRNCLGYSHVLGLTGFVSTAHLASPWYGGRVPREHPMMNRPKSYHLL